MNRKYVIFFITFLSFIISSYSQVSENFDGWSDTSYGGVSTYTGASGQWETNNSITNSSNSRTGNAVRFNDDSGSNEYLLYKGLDGNGKDNGIGTLSFWYRHWNGGASIVQFQSQYSTNGGTNWINIGSVVSATSITYSQFSQAVDISADNILIRVISINDAERLMIDDFNITNFTTTDTELNFSSATYMQTENGGSINLCVDITNHSGSTATTANVVLTSSNTPHLTSPISLGINFPAGSSTQQCVNIPIADNTDCNDSTDYTFELQSVSGGTSASAGSTDTTTLSVTDDDGTLGVFKTLSFETGDDWSYTGSGSVNSTTNKFNGTSSYRIGGSNNLTTVDIDITGFSNVSLAVAFASLGCDSGEDFYLDISYDGGTSWNGTGSVKLIDGFGNANINIGNTNASNPTTVATNPWVVNVSDAETQIRVRLRAVGLDAGEYYFVDDIILTGESCATSANIVISPSSLSGMDYVVGSGPTTTPVPFDVIGSNLTSDIFINGLTDFEISTSSGGTYSSTLTIPLASANGTTTLYARLSSGLSVGPYSETMFASSTGAPSTSIPVNSSVIPTLANVVITEIMYNTFSSDDDWIEICNESGSTQYLNNYQIDVGGAVVYTFPSSVILVDGECIIVDLGDGGGSEYNIDCSISPIIYSSGLGSGTLNNTGDTITLYAQDGTTLADTVTYSNADGANGNGPSLHVIDHTADNSNTSSNWQEVNDGGSPLSNALVGPCTPNEPDINVEGNVGNFPDIPGDASNVPVGYNNTLFAVTPIGGSQMKSFRIQNTGVQTLSISSIITTGAPVGEFVISGAPASVAPGQVAIFNVTFNPSTLGTRTAIVRINNTDPDASENPYEFNVQGEGVCSASTISVSSFAPASGPEGTEVTITGNGFSATSTVTINGLTANVISGSATQLIVEIPAITVSGPFVITEGSCYTISANNFNLLEDNGGCGLTDLIFSEIYDHTGGSLGYFEVFNGTGATIDLSTYFVRRYGNPTDLTNNVYTDYYFTPSLDFINDGEVLYGKISDHTDTASPDFDFEAINSFAGINADDIFHLYNGNSIVDVYVVPFGTGLGYTALRNVNTAGPNTSSNPGDWTHLNTEDIGDLGTFNYTTIIDIPTVNPPDDVTGCGTIAEFDATGTASGGGGLTYQWYFNTGVSTWNQVTGGDFPGLTVSGITGPILTLTGPFYNFSGYQFYCMVVEAGACGTASNAAQIKSNTTTWNGTWSNGDPTISSAVIINQNYDTATSSIGSFSACSVTINAGRTLNIRNGDHVEINFDLIVNGTLDIETEGSLVMIDDSGTVTNNGTTNVHKITTVMETYDYTYWSPPVDYSSPGTTAQTVLAGFIPQRIYSFNTSNFFDIEDPDGNPGADGFDDNQNSWTHHYAYMVNGIGYAAMTDGTGGHQRTITFNGRVNTGDIQVAVSLSGNAADTNDDWNLLGNPYPSAISADDFVAHNTNLSGTVYLWTHEDDVLITNPGPDAYNFHTNDYAMYNTVGGIGTSSTGMVVSNVPTGYIASGQGFFIDADTAGTVEFKNNMRDKLHANDDFFRSTGNSSSNRTEEKDRMWINMTNPDGVFSQILIGYMPDGTLEKDRLYDGIRLEGSNYIDFYSKDNTTFKYGIQGRPPFSIDDIIPVGYDSNVLGDLTISLYETEGVLSEVTVYLRDIQLDTVHNLSDSDYIFTAEVGSFTERFEIFYDYSLSVEEVIITSNDLSIIELSNGDVQFTVGDNHHIKSVEIIDVLGRTLYRLKGNSNIEVYNLSNLSQSTYIAKVELSNGQIISKKAIKQK